MTSRYNALDQALDVAGSLTHTATMVLADELLFLGARIAGQTGVAATVTAGTPAVVTNLTGMTQASEGNWLEIEGSSLGNDGYYLIVNYVSGTSVQISAPLAVTEGSLTWIERAPYSLEDDLNYARTDRAAIKGVDYYDPIPTYYRCTDQLTPVAANLSNIAGKTTDAKSFVTNRVFDNQSVDVGDTYITLVSAGQLKHADAVDVTGVPIDDGWDAGNEEATYAEILDGYGNSVHVLTGIYDGYRVFGVSRAGTTGISPNSVEITFRAVANGYPISDSVPYTWEAGQSDVVDVYYGYRDCLDSMSETAFRTTLVNGVIGDATALTRINNILQTIGTSLGDTDLAGLLTNTGNYYPFSNLPDITPSVVEALNTLNEQIGDRNYTGPILTDGYTITQSIQELANAISNTSNITRIIERVGADYVAGSTITIPGGYSYTVDGTFNGQNLWVYWRGLLRSPGAVANGDDYQEASTTSIVNYSLIKQYDHINWFVIG